MFICISHKNNNIIKRKIRQLQSLHFIRQLNTNIDFNKLNNNNNKNNENVNNNVTSTLHLVTLPVAN